MKLKYSYSNDRFNNLSIFELCTSYKAYYFLMFLSVPLAIEFYDLFVEPGFKEKFFSMFFLVEKIYTYEVLAYLALGLLSFWIGERLARKLAIKPSTLLRARWSADRLYKVSIIVFLLGYAIKLLRYVTNGVNYQMYASGTISGNPKLTFFITPNTLHTLALLLCIIGYFSSKYEGRTRDRSLFLYTGIAMALFYYLGVMDLGSKMKMLSPIVCIFIVKLCYFPERLSGIIKSGFKLVFLACLIFAVDGIKDNIAHGSHKAEAEQPFIYKLSPFIVRVSQVQTVTQIVEKDEQYLLGTTFRQFFEELKPNSLQNEPTINGNEFGRKYRIIGPNDYVTGVAITNPGELYLNFGFIGIAIGLFILGLLYRILYTFLSNCNMFFVLIYPVIWVSLIHGVESQVSSVLALLVKNFILIFLIHLALVRFRISR